MSTISKDKIKDQKEKKTLGNDGKKEGESNFSGEKEEQMTKIEKVGKKAWT